MLYVLLDHASVQHRVIFDFRGLTAINSEVFPRSTFPLQQFLDTL